MPPSTSADTTLLMESAMKPAWLYATSVRTSGYSSPSSSSTSSASRATATVLAPASLKTIRHTLSAPSYRASVSRSL